MIIRDAEGDFWEELESGGFACVTDGMPFRSQEYLERNFGPLTEYVEVVKP